MGGQVHLMNPGPCGSSRILAANAATMDRPASLRGNLEATRLRSGENGLLTTLTKKNFEMILTTTSTKKNKPTNRGPQARLKSTNRGFKEAWGPRFVDFKWACGPRSVGLIFIFVFGLAGRVYSPSQPKSVSSFCSGTKAADAFGLAGRINSASQPKYK